VEPVRAGASCKQSVIAKKPCLESQRRLTDRGSSMLHSRKILQKSVLNRNKTEVEKNSLF
jgi:hypothetical protein